MNQQEIKLQLWWCFHHEQQRHDRAAAACPAGSGTSPETPPASTRVRVLLRVLQLREHIQPYDTEQNPEQKQVSKQVCYLSLLKFLNHLFRRPIIDIILTSHMTSEKSTAVITLWHCDYSWNDNSLNGIWNSWDYYLVIRIPQSNLVIHQKQIITLAG